MSYRGIDMSNVLVLIGVIEMVGCYSVLIGGVLIGGEECEKRMC